MHPTPALRSLAAAFTLGAACAAATAAPVQLTYSGSVSGHQYDDGTLSAFSPVGTAMSLSLTFNDTFSDGTYDFSDNLGPVSGTMQVGALSYTFNDFTPFSYNYNPGDNSVNWVYPQFLGAGDEPAGGDLFGLFVQLTPALTVMNPISLGFGFTNGLVTSYRYVQFTGSGVVTPVGTVPVPATLPLVAAALLALALNRRRPAH